MLNTGAQRVAVPGRLEAKEREKPEPVKIVPPEPISRRSAAYSEPPSSDSITVPDLPRPSKPPVISDRSRSAIPVFHGGDVSSKITTRAAVSDETDIPPVPQKLTISSFKAPLWTSRLAAFETLHRGLEDPAAAEFDFTASKIAEILSIGLDDSHAKVLTAAMQSVKIFVERYPTEPRYLDMYLGRAINLAKATSASSTRQAVAAAGELLEALKLAYDSESVLIASINVLGASDWAKVSRVRIGALDLIQSTLQEQPLLASRTNGMSYTL